MKQLCALLIGLHWAAWAFCQPYYIEGTWLDGGSWNSDIDTLTDRGTHRFYRSVTTGTSGNRELLFNNPDDDYTPKWVADNATPLSTNAYLAGGAKYYNSGGSNINFYVNSGSYYTLVIGENTGSDNDLSILETAYDPKDITGVSQSPATVYSGQEVTVTIAVSAALSTGEYAYLRYTTDSWASSGISAFTMTDTTGTATIPALPNGTAVAYYAFTSNRSSAPTPAQADYFSLNIYNAAGQNTAGSNFSYTVTGWSTVSGATDWSAGASWNAGVAPTPGSDMGAVTIGHSISMDQDNAVSAISIASGVTLTVDNGATLTTSGGISGSGSITVAGTLQLNTGGYTNISPTYASGSTLVYNTGGTYGRSSEWNAASGSGYPYNIQISNSTELDYPNGDLYADLGLAGSLTIDAGASLSMDNGIGPDTGAIAIEGDLILNGNLTLGDGYGGDISLKGNWTMGSGAVFDHNDRAVFFKGSSDQVISAAGGGVTFGYMVIDKPAGSLVLDNSPATSVTIAVSSGDILQMNNTGGLDLNGQRFTISQAGGSIQLNYGGRSISSALPGALFSIEGAAGDTLAISTPGTLTFGANVTLGLSRSFDPGTTASVVTVNGALQINANGELLDTLTYGPAATLVFACNSDTTSPAWVSGSSPGAGVPYNVTLNMSGVSSTLTTAGTLTVPGKLTISKGVLNADYNLDIDGDLSIGTNGLLDGSDVTVTVGGNWSANSTQSPNGYKPNTSGTVILNGTGSLSFTHAGGATFKNLGLTGSGTYTFNSDVNVQTALTISNGTCDFGTHRLYGGGTLTMSGGTLMLGDTAGPLPELSGTYTITGGTIALTGAAAQELRGGEIYSSLEFSGGGTKTISSAIDSISGTVIIPDATAVDLENKTFGGATTDFTMSGNGRLIVGGTGTKPDMGGTYAITAGTVEFTNSSATAQAIRNKTYFNIEVSGANVGNSSGNITLAAGGSFTILPGGVFKINADAIKGPAGVQTVTIDSGAIFRCGDADGFSGSANTSIDNTIETVVIQPGSTVEFSRNSAQVLTGRNDYAHIIISGTGTKTADDALVISGNLTLEGALADGGNTIEVGGNILGMGTHSGSGKIRMTGSGATISGTTLGNLELDNTDGFALSGSPQIDSVLTITNGSLSLGAYTLTLANSDSAAITGFDSGNYIITEDTGMLQRAVDNSTTYIFPVGSSTNYNPAILTTGASAGYTDIRGRFIDSVPSVPSDLLSSAYGAESTPISTFLDNGYWQLEGEGTPQPFQLVLQASGVTNLGALAEQHAIFRNPDASGVSNGTGWSPAGTPVDVWNGNDSVPTTGFGGVIAPQSDNVASMSFFAIGRSDNPFVLPIVLTDFEAALSGVDVVLTWTTASEVNSDFFIVERSLDGSIWNPVGQVDAAGFSSAILHYQYTDHEPPGTVLYYRLRQVDFNGQFTLSAIRVVNNLGNDTYQVLGYYTLSGQRLESLEHAPSGIYLLRSNRGFSKILHCSDE